MDVNKILNSNPDIKKKAVAALIQKGGMSSLEALVLLSLDSNPGVRYAARKGLSFLRQEFAKFGKNIDHNIREIFIEKNLEILKAASGEDQIKAAERLARSDAGNHARDLVNTIQKSEDSKLIATLLKTIASSCGSRSLPLLKKYLKSPDSRIRANAVEAISLLEISERYDLVLPYLSDKDRRVTCNASVTLWSFCREKVYDRLKQMLDSNDMDQIKSVIWCLRTIGTLETRGLLAGISREHPAYTLAADAVRKLDKALALSLGDKSSSFDSAMSQASAVSGISDSSGISPVSAKKSGLIEKLHSDIPAERLDAAKELSKFRDTALLPQLTDCLNSEEDPYVIATLVKLIGLTGSSKSSQVIIPFLNNPDARVRANTIEGLSTIEDEDVIKTLKPLLLDKEPRVKANAALVIHRRFPEQIIKILKDMLVSEDTWKSLSAAFALGNLNDPDAEKVLKECVDKLPEGSRPKIDEILNSIENRRFHESMVIADELSTVQNLAYTSIEDAFNALEAEDAATKIKGLRCLSILGDDKCGKKIEKLIKTEESFIIKAEMIRTLGDLRKENCIHILKKAIHEKSRPVRNAAAYALADINTPSSLACLEELLESSDTSLAAIGISALLKSRQPELKTNAQKRIDELITSESSLDRNQAVTCLSEFQDSWSLQALTRLSKDYDINVAKAAKEVLKQFEHNTAEKVRAVAAKAHYRIDALEDDFVRDNKNFIIDIQIDLLETPDPDLKKQALINLNSLIGPDTLSHFKKILMTQQNKFLKATIIKVVGRHKSPKTIDVLEQFLKDYDPRVRANCVESLNGFKDPIIYDLVSPLLYDNDERVKINAYRILADLFPYKTKGKLMDMLEESKGYSRSLRKRFYESAMFIIKSESDQICTELTDWLEGRRKEDKAALEKAKELEDERVKMLSQGKESKFHTETESDDNEYIHLFKFFGKIALFIIVAIGGLLFYHSETRVDKSKDLTYTLDTDSRSYDATNILTAIEDMNKSDFKPGVKVKGRRIRTGSSILRKALKNAGQRKEEKGTFAYRKALNQKMAVKALDESRVDDPAYREMMIQANMGSESIFNAENLILRGQIAEAQEILQESLRDAFNNPALKSRIYYLLMQCSKSLDNAENFVKYSQEFDLLRTEIGLMSFKAGVYDSDKVDVEKIKEDIKNVKDFKSNIANMSSAEKQEFMAVMKKSLAESGYKGKSLDFEFRVLKARFDL